MTSFLVAQSGMAEKVAHYEEELARLPQTFVPVTHHVCGGIYTRTGLIEAGTPFIGAVHKKDHQNVICGDVTVLTDDGPVRFTGYHVIECRAGSKRVAYAHADTTWTTIVRTDRTDVREIEDECVENSGSLQTRALTEIQACS
jgi:hypothetical protein